MVEFVAIAFGGAIAILLLGKYIDAPLQDFQKQTDATKSDSMEETAAKNDDLIEKMSRGEIDIDEIVRKSRDKSQTKLRKDFVKKARGELGGGNAE